MRTQEITVEYKKIMDVLQAAELQLHPAYLDVPVQLFRISEHSGATTLTPKHVSTEPWIPMLHAGASVLRRLPARMQQLLRPGTDGADARFKRDFLDRSFGHSCKVCDRLWFDNNLTRISSIPNERHRTNAIAVLHQEPRVRRRCCQRQHRQTE